MSKHLDLRPVDRENLDATLRMKVTPEQNAFVAPNVVSMAQAAVMPEFCPYLAMEGDTPVGFTLWTLADHDDGECWMHRLMVPTALQGQGYGRAILEAAIRQIRADRPDAKRLYISFVPGNDVARHLYERVGFVPDGRVLEGEIVYCLDFEQ